MISVFKRTWVPWTATLIILLIWGGLQIYRSTSSDLKNLTPESLQSARTFWRANRPKSYKFQVQISRAESELLQIEVKDGIVVEMTTDGKPVPTHTWAYWTIDGMLGFLDEELAAAQNPMATFQTDDKSKVYLSASFDATLGYPVHYLRQVFGRPLTIEWKIQNFTVK